MCPEGGRFGGGGVRVWCEIVHTHAYTASVFAVAWGGKVVCACACVLRCGRHHPGSSSSDKITTINYVNIGRIIVISAARTPGFIVYALCLCGYVDVDARVYVYVSNRMTVEEAEEEEEDTLLDWGSLSAAIEYTHTQY